MTLTSALLSKDTRIQEAYSNRNRPIAFGEPQSQSVARVQVALTQVGYSMPKSVSSTGADGIFLDETLATVRQFQADNGLRVDGMIGEHTLDALDAALNRLPGPPPPTPPPPAPNHEQLIQSALIRSRAAVHMALARLMSLRGSIETVDKLSGPQKVAAIVTMTASFQREIAIVAKRLLVSRDPIKADFRDALDKAIPLIRQNLAASSKIKDDGVTGRCDPKKFKPPGTPFGATNADQPDPRVSVCDPFFDIHRVAFTLQDLQRDVITHEFFHLVGLEDIEGVDTTQKALDNANTLAQIVAWTVDRHRQKNSDGNEAATQDEIPSG